MPRKSKTPEVSLATPKPAPAKAQPVESPRIEFILHKDTDGFWGPSFELTEAEFDALTQELERLRNIPATSPDPAWLTRGRNAECMRAFDSLLASGGKDIAEYQRFMIGAAALVSDHGEDSYYPTEALVFAVLQDFCNARISADRMQENMESFARNREDLEEAMNVYASNRLPRLSPQAEGGK